MVLDREAERAIEHFKQSLGHSMAIPPNSLNNLHKIIDHHTYTYAKHPEVIQISCQDYDSLMRDTQTNQMPFMYMGNDKGTFRFQGVAIIPTHTLGVGEVVINPTSPYMPLRPDWGFRDGNNSGFNKHSVFSEARSRSINQELSSYVFPSKD